MPQHHIGKLRICLLQMLPKQLHILDKEVAWVLRLAKISPFFLSGHGSAVSKVILTGHHKAVPAKISGKGIVPVHVLDHPVRQLNNSARLPCRLIPDRTNLRLLIRRQIGELRPSDFLFHNPILLFYAKSFRFLSSISSRFSR